MKKSVKKQDWTEVDGFPNYEIHPTDGIRNAKTKKTLKGRNWKGYPKVTLMRDGKKHEKRIHKLVGEHFIDNPDGLSIVNHIDSDRGNHSVSNLEWVDNSGNQLHRWRTQKEGLKKKIYGDEYGKNKNIYQLEIKGAKVQNVGLRKNLHKILDETKMGGVAVNDPYKNKVEAFISGKDKDRRVAIQKLRGYIKDKTGYNIQVTERPVTKSLQKVSLTKQQLKDVSNTQYLAYMATSGDNKRNKIETGIEKAERDVLPRFRLKKTDDGKYEGVLPAVGVKQLTGRAPHYRKFMKDNHSVSIDEALMNMSPSDRKSVKSTIRRVGYGSIE